MENTRITISLNIWEDDNDPEAAPSFCNTITFKRGDVTYKRPLRSIEEDLNIRHIIKEAYEFKQFACTKH